jgi:hypothetical protein
MKESNVRNRMEIPADEEVTVPRPAGPVKGRRHHLSIAHRT